MKTVSKSNGADEAAANEKRSTGFGRILLWAAAGLMLYFLSIGPVAMLIDKGIPSAKTEDFLTAVYLPVEWAYEETPLHKPIGMYLRLWSKRFDKDGELE